MSVAEIVLRVLEAVLSWPVAALVVGLVFLKRFERAISDFIRRVVRAEAYGARVEASRPEEQTREADAAQDLPRQDDIRRYISDNPGEVLAAYERAVRGFTFERAYNLIYGSQLELLEHLESLGSTGEDYVNLVPYFNEFRERSQLESAQFATYLSFLLTLEFIESVGAGNDLRMKITPLGIDFLNYIRAEYGSTYKFKPF